MYSYTSLILYAALAEVCRRVVLVLLKAFTGPLSKIPGPFYGKISAVPWIIENITGNAMNVIDDLFEQYGPVVRIAPQHILVVSKDGISKILIDDDLMKGPMYENIRPSKHITTLISETDKVAYRQKRRLLSPGFSISYINGLEPQMLECIKELEDTLDAGCVEGNGFAVVDMSKYLANLTFDIMSATSFGGSFHLVSSQDSSLKNAFLDYLQRTALKTIFPFLEYVPGMDFTKGPAMTKMLRDIINKRRSEKDQNKRDLLKIFFDANESDPIAFSDLHLEEEMTLFMIAGSDTSGVTLTQTLLLLLNHPEKMRLLEAEIFEVFISNEPSTFANTQELPYLNAVINESMRIMPIVTVGLGRWTTETTIIAGYEIPPKAILSAAPKILMKDKKIWPDADKFVPERWLGSYKGAEVDRKAFFPFSAGSRNCIGQQFALKEMRLILVMLIRRYELMLIPGQSHELRTHTVPWFKQGFYNVGVRRRV